MHFENSTWFIWTYQFVISFGFCIFLLANIIATTIRKSRSNLPPGPTGLPIVGYLPFLTQYKHLDFLKLAKKYGDIFSIRLGSMDSVIMHGGDAVLQSLNDPAIFGRSPILRSIELKPISIFLGSNFDSWKEQRMFTFNTLKDLGFGKTVSEQDIQDEICRFMNFIRSHKTQPINVEKELFSSILNNMSALVFGKRFEYGSPEHNVLYEQVAEEFNHLLPVPLEMAFPWLLYIPFASKFCQTRKMRALNKACGYIFYKEITNHKATYDSTHLRDFVDRYLFEIYTRKEKNQNSSFNHTMLMEIVRTLFAAGSEPVQISLLWFIYIMVSFPEVQKKIQKEIRNIIDSEKTPEFMDMKNMPYTHAVILESMRWQSVGPLSIPRCALKDTIVEGYLIPKGSVVFHNLWAVHHDPRYWDEPEIFKPERFLSSDGMGIVKSKYFMPFSRGGRMCPGESMAILEMFLYCTSILKEFNIVLPDGIKPLFKTKCTISYRLEPYLVKFIPIN